MSEFNDTVYAEQSVLGSILINPKCFADVRQRLSASSFLSALNEAVYQAICDLDSNEKPIDPVTVLDKLRESAEYNESSAVYVRDLMLITPTAVNVMEYVRVVVSHAARRKVFGISEAALERFAEGESVRDVARWMRDETDAICESTAEGGLVTSMDAMLSFAEYRERLERGEVKATVASGYKKLNEVLGGGFVTEGFYVLAARPGSGKTTFALNIAEKIAKHGTPVLFVSLEMSLEQLTAKRIAIESGLSSTWILNDPTSGEKEWKKMLDASGRLADRPLYFNGMKNAGISDIEQLASQIKGLGIVIIDYLGLLKHDEGKTLYEKVTYTSNKLKRTARTLGCPILCLAQLNRESAGRPGGEPRLSELRDSGAIEQDIDGGILLHKYDYIPEENAPHRLGVAVAKNRHGGVGKFDLNWYLVNGRIDGIEYR